MPAMTTICFGSCALPAVGHQANAKTAQRTKLILRERRPSGLPLPKGEGRVRGPRLFVGRRSSEANGVINVHVDATGTHHQETFRPRSLLSSYLPIRACD